MTRTEKSIIDKDHPLGQMMNLISNLDLCQILLLVHGGLELYITLKHFYSDHRLKYLVLIHFLKGFDGLLLIIVIILCLSHVLVPPCYRKFAIIYGLLELESCGVSCVKSLKPPIMTPTFPNSKNLLFYL